MGTIDRPDDRSMKSRMFRLGLACAAMASGPLALCSRAENAAVVGPSPWWRQFGVRDLNGASLDPSARWFVVVYMGQECPVSNESIPILNKLSAEFSSKGFVVVGAFVDPTADLAALRTHVADYAVGFATADDRDHRLVRASGATYTPEVAVFSSRGILLYKGRIDDRVGSFGASRPAAVHQDLRDALTAIAAGSNGPFKGSRGFGCAIPEAVPQ
jgi:hypothetical protein